MVVCWWVVSEKNMLQFRNVQKSLEKDSQFIRPRNETNRIDEQQQKTEKRKKRKM